MTENVKTKSEESLIAKLASIKAMRLAFYSSKDRCYNPENPQYRYYGGRGITICDSWLASFENYLSDMGVRPDGHTLERIDNDKGYSPDNCKWATRAEQTANRGMTKKLTFKGETKTLVEWAAITGISYSTIKARVNLLGYTPEQALTKDVKCGAKLEGKFYKPRTPYALAGKDNPNRCITTSQCEVIRLRFAEGASKLSLAQEYGVSRSLIGNIILKKRGYE